MSKISPENPIKVPSAKPEDQPASRRMLFMVRDELQDKIDEFKSELKTEISEVRRELKAEISKVKSELKAEISDVKSELKGEISEVRSELKAEMSEMKAMIHRSNILAEEQRADNRIVLEGLQLLWERQERFERAN